MHVKGKQMTPLGMTKNGAKVDLSFQGKTKDGTQIRITAKCAVMPR
jgi:hypothetical protein